MTQPPHRRPSHAQLPPARPPPSASKSTRLQHALVAKSATPTREPVERFGSANSMGVWTFIAWPDNMISIGRCRAAGRNGRETRNVQSGAKNRFRSHGCGPLRTFQFEQLQWWGQRRDRDGGGGGPEALSRFLPRLGTLRCQSISKTSATSTALHPDTPTDQSFDLEVTPWAPTRLTCCISPTGPEESSGASTLSQTAQARP